LVLLGSLLMVGCRTNESKIQATQDIDAISTNVAATMYAEVAIEEPTITPTMSGEISVDSDLFDVDITLPASLFSDDYMATFNADTYAAENGFKKAVVNEDGSITITVSKARHKEMLEEYAAQLNKTFNEMIGGEDTPYITGITSNSDFTSIIIDVNRVGYESAFDFSAFTIGIDSMFYQSIAGMDLHCEITIRNGNTKETISTVVYPDVIQQMQD